MKIWIILMGLLMGSGFSLAEVNAKISFVGMKGAFNGLYFSNDGKATEVRALMVGLSKAVGYKGGPQLAFYDDESQAKKGQGVEVCSVSLPENSKRILVVFTEDEEGVQVAHAFDISDLIGKDRLIKFVNLSGKDLTVNVEEIACDLGDGDTEAITKKDLVEDEVQVQVREASEEGEPEGRRYYANNWGVDENTHEIVVLVKSKSRGRPIDVRRLEEVILDK